MAAWRTFLALFVAFALSACQTAGETFDAVNPFSDSVDIDSRLIDQYLAVQEIDSLAFPAAPDPARPPALLPRGEGVDAALSEHYGVLDIPAAEAALNEILGRMKATLPGGAPPARVYIQPGKGFGARADRSGAIFVNLGTLGGVDEDGSWESSGLTDDQLAFLIGHEYAHILLDHFAQNEASEQMVDAAAFVRLAMVARNSLDSDRDEEDLNRNMRGPNVALAVTEATLLRSWGRTQEHEADLMAFDLMQAAGFNGAEARNALSRIRDVNEILSDVPLFNQAEVDSLIGQAMRGELSKDSLVERGVDAGFVLFGRMSQSIFGKNHPTQAERQDLLREYRQKQYVEIRRDYLQQRRPSSRALLDPLGRDDRFMRWRRAYDLTADAIALTRVEEGAAALAGGAGAEAGAPFDPAFDQVFRAARAALQGVGEEDAFLRERFASLREREGKPDVAIENLMLVVRAKGERTPLATLLDLADRQLGAGAFREALGTVQMAIRYYPDAETWYPQKIAAEMLTGQHEQAERTLAACRIQGTVATTIACRERARGKGPGFDRADGPDAAGGVQTLLQGAAGS